MSTHHEAFSKQPGSAPGEAVFVGERSDRPFSVRRIEFDAESLESLETADVGAAVAGGASGRVVWLHVSGLHEAEHVAAVCGHYELPALVVEDILNSSHRPKAEEADGYLFVIAPLVNERSGELATDHFCVACLDGVLLSFSDAADKVLEPVVARLRAGRPRIRGSGSDYLMWALLDSAVDHAIDAFEGLEDRLGALEERVESREPVTSAEVFARKREVAQVYRRLRPVREIAVYLERSESALIGPRTRPFLRDLYDHAVRLNETGESLREAASNVRDFYLAEVSNRMNEVMKVLTCVATIFMPLGFLAGVYGMNFEWIPELGFRWGYPLLWCAFLLIAGALLWLFRRIRWL